MTSEVEFAEQACKVSRRMRKHQRRGLEVASDWVEHALATEMEMYLAPRIGNLSWFELRLLDCYAFIMLLCRRNCNCGGYRCEVLCTADVRIAEEAGKWSDLSRTSTQEAKLTEEVVVFLGKGKYKVPFLSPAIILFSLVRLGNISDIDWRFAETCKCVFRLSFSVCGIV